MLRLKISKNFKYFPLAKVFMSKYLPKIKPSSYLTKNENSHCGVYAVIMFLVPTPKD